MRSIQASKVVDAVERLCRETASILPCDVREKIKSSLELETSILARGILGQILENIEIAAQNDDPLCQDTGFSVFFVKLGSEVFIEGGDLNFAIAEGVARGHINGYLRKSIVRDPLDRTTNTGDNTPPVIWLELAPGDHLEIIYAPKGGGSENMSRIAMLKPSDSASEVEDFIVNSVIEAGGNPCPPVIVGVGIGGTFEKCAFLAKKALLREIGSRHESDFYSAMEQRLLARINETGIGPMGLGGKTTALEVFIEVHPCHIASLPIAINLNCHCARHRKVIL